MPILTPATSDTCWRPAAGPHRHGLTLLELAVVMFIIGLLTIVALPKLRNSDRSELDATAERLVALARYLSEEAALRGTELRLNYDLDAQRYFVTVLDRSLEEPDFVPDPGHLSKPAALPDSVSMVDVGVGTNEKLTAGSALTQFYPEGYADSTIIHLRSRSGDYATVVIEPLTGKAAAYEGYEEGGAVALEM